MRLTATILISAMLGIVSAQSFEVPIITRTQKDSPVTLQGFVQATTKKSSDGRIFPSYELRGSVTNSSSLDILLVVIKFDAKNLYFNNETIIKSTDYFFETEPFMPNSVALFEASGLPYGMSKVKAVSMPASGKVIGKVAFVQFSNGRTFGIPSEAADALRARANALDKLRTLKATYDANGPERFIGQLESYSETPFVNAVYSTYQKEKSIRLAIQKLDSMLQAAKSHGVK